MDEKIKNSISKVSHIHSLTANFLMNELKKKGFNEYASSHGNILFQLSKVSKLKMNELAQKINRDKSTTTVLVRKLEKDGLLCMQYDENDRRNKFVMLTEKGREYNKNTQEISNLLLQKFYSDFTEDEKELFVNFLERIENNF